jgi:hypothetical protein
VRLTAAPEPRRACIERIDDDHANARKLWQEMGEPEYPTRSQLDHLRSASLLVKEPCTVGYNDGAIEFDLALPPHGMAMVTLELAPASIQDGRGEAMAHKGRRKEIRESDSP